MGTSQESHKTTVNKKTVKTDTGNVRNVF